MPSSFCFNRWQSASNFSMLQSCPLTRARRGDTERHASVISDLRVGSCKTDGFDFLNADLMMMKSCLITLLTSVYFLLPPPAPPLNLLNSILPSSDLGVQL